MSLLPNSIYNQTPNNTSFSIPVSNTHSQYYNYARCTQPEKYVDSFTLGGYKSYDYLDGMYNNATKTQYIYTKDSPKPLKIKRNMAYEKSTVPCNLNYN